MDHMLMFLIALWLTCASLTVENHGLRTHGRDMHPTLTVALGVVSIMMWVAGLMAWLT